MQIKKANIIINIDGQSYIDIIIFNNKITKNCKILYYSAYKREFNIFDAQHRYFENAIITLSYENNNEKYFPRNS